MSLSKAQLLLLSKVLTQDQLLLLSNEYTSPVSTGEYTSRITPVSTGEYTARITPVSTGSDGESDLSFLLGDNLDRVDLITTQATYKKLKAKYGSAENKKSIDLELKYEGNYFIFHTN